jgi:hypothetical protein
MSNLHPLAVALASVDPSNDGHWTMDGQVKVDVVCEVLAKLGVAPVTRQDIISAAPTFTRTTAPEFIKFYEGELDAAEKAMHKSSPMATKPAAPAAPAQEAQAAKPSVLSTPLPKLLASPELLRDAIVELDAKSQELIIARRKLDEELSSIAAKAEFCARALSRIEPKENPSDGIQAYLAQQRKVREARIGRTRQFIEAGVKPTDLVAELAGPSKLDSAMSRRKAPLGAGRPTTRVPVTMQQGAG